MVQESCALYIHTYIHSVCVCVFYRVKYRQIICEYNVCVWLQRCITDLNLAWNNWTQLEKPLIWCEEKKLRLLDVDFCFISYSITAQTTLLRHSCLSNCLAVRLFSNPTSTSHPSHISISTWCCQPDGQWNPAGSDIKQSWMTQHPVTPTGHHHFLKKDNGQTTFNTIGCMNKAKANEEKKRIKAFRKKRKLLVCVEKFAANRLLLTFSWTESILIQLFSSNTSFYVKMLQIWQQGPHEERINFVFLHWRQYSSKTKIKKSKQLPSPTADKIKSSPFQIQTRLFF